MSYDISLKKIASSIIDINTALEEIANGLDFVKSGTPLNPPRSGPPRIKMDHLFSDDHVQIVIKHFKRDHGMGLHQHFDSTEYFIIVSGKIRVDDKVFGERDVLTVDCKVNHQITAITDASVLCILIPPEKIYRNMEKLIKEKLGEN